MSAAYDAALGAALTTLVEETDEAAGGRGTTP
jgi:hypothetical protein